MIQFWDSSLTVFAMYSGKKLERLSLDSFAVPTLWVGSGLTRKNKTSFTKTPAYFAQNVSLKKKVSYYLCFFDMLLTLEAIVVNNSLALVGRVSLC
jgi:hypothetical protein